MEPEVKIGSIIKITEFGIGYISNSPALELYNCSGVINRYYVVKNMVDISTSLAVVNVPTIDLLAKSSNPSNGKKIIPDYRLYKDENYRLVTKNELNEFIAEIFNNTKGILCMNLEETILCLKMRNQVLYKQEKDKLDIDSLKLITNEKNKYRISKGFPIFNTHLINNDFSELIYPEDLESYLNDKEIIQMSHLKLYLEIFAEQHNL